MCIVDIHVYRFFFNNPSNTEIYPLSLHRRSSDLGRAPARAVAAAPQRARVALRAARGTGGERDRDFADDAARVVRLRSEEHTSELQSQSNLVCRVLLDKTDDGTH